jgi:hypothetical protein
MREIASLLTGGIKSTTRNLVVSLIVYAIVGLLALTAYVALLYALGLAISRPYGPMVAALSIAGATIVLALIALLVLNIRARRAKQLRMLRTRSVLSAGTSAGAAALVPMLVRASPVGSMAAVAVLAYVVSRAGQRRD